MRLFLVVAVVGVLAVFAESVVSNLSASPDIDQVHVLHDDTHNVTCWTRYNGGVSCWPYHMLEALEK